MRMALNRLLWWQYILVMLHSSTPNYPCGLKWICTHTHIYITSLSVQFLGPEHCYWLVFISFLTKWFTRWWITHGWIQGGALELHKSGLTIVFLLTSSNLANWGTTLNFIHYSYKYHLTITNNSYWSHLHQRLSHGWSFETPRTFGQEAFSAGPRSGRKAPFDHPAQAQLWHVGMFMWVQIGYRKGPPEQVSWCNTVYNQAN